MPLLVAFIFGFFPMFFYAAIVYWFDRYEKEPRYLLGAVFSWGAIVAAGAAFVVNSFFEVGVYLATGSGPISEIATSSFIAPVTEELLKGFAVLVVFFVFKDEFDSILDGIVYAAITALGFAATENVFYIYELGYLESGWPGLFSLAAIRIFLVGWQHPFYTAFTGIGLAKSRLSKNGAVRFLAPLAGLAVAMTAHAIHNTLPTLFGNNSLFVTTFFDWSGLLMMFIFILVMIYYEGRMIRRHLYEEMSQGLLTPQLHRAASSSWMQLSFRLNALFNCKYRQTDRFFQVCAELAHKKEQYARLGEEHNNSEIIAKLRTEMQDLALRVV